MKVQIVLEGSFVERFKDEAEERVAGVFNHMQNFFLDPSLGVKFHLEKLSPIKLAHKIAISNPNLR